MTSAKTLFANTTNRRRTPTKLSAFKLHFWLGEFGFFARAQNRSAESKVLRLHWIARTVLERHIKVRGEANPYDTNDTEDFERRRCFAWRTLPRKRTGRTVLAGV